MKNLSSQAHPGTIPHSPFSGKINLFANKVFLLYSSAIHSFKSKTFKPYSVWRERKRDPIFHIWTLSCGFSSIWLSFRKGFFFQVLRFFFQRHYGQKGRNFKQNPLRSYNSNLLLAYFYIACQISSAWLRKSYTISVRSHKSKGECGLFLTWKRPKKIRENGTVNQDFQNRTQTLDNARTVPK